MKTRVKRILCLVVAVLLCFSLAGCKELDYARAHHAIMQKDGSILLNGEKYVALPYCEDFHPPMGRVESVAVTDPDVPVLVSDFFAMFHMYIGEEGIIQDGHILGNGDTYYCSEKDAAEIAARIASGSPLSGMRYSYSHWDEENCEWEEKTIRLTEEEMNAVKRVLATVEPLTAEDIDGQYSVSLEWCSDDNLFSRTIGDVYYYNGRYAIVNWDEIGDMSLYEVPTEYNAMFEKISADAIASEEAFYKANGWY